MRRFVQIHLDAPVLERAVGLRGPRTAGLAVAGRRLSENAAQVVVTGAFATRELLDAAFPVERGLVFGHGRVLAVRVRVITDFMVRQRSNHVASAAPLERPPFFAHHLERRPDVLLGKKQGDAFRCVVALGQDVVFGVKPEDDVDAALLRPLGSERARSRNESAREDRAQQC